MIANFGWRSVKRLAAGLWLSVFLSGCMGHEIQLYQPNPPDPNTSPLPLKVAVVELEDRNPPSFWRGSGMALIPGVLFATNIQEHSAGSFGKCLAKELKASKLFSNVDYFDAWDPLAETFGDYSLIVTGSVQRDQITQTETLFGLSAVGVLFSFFIPNTFLSHDVALEFVAMSPSSPYNNIWKHSVQFEEPTKTYMFLGAPYREYRRAEFDPCSTEHLQPEFLELRNSLVQTLKDHRGTLQEGASSGDQRERKL